MRCARIITSRNRAPVPGRAGTDTKQKLGCSCASSRALTTGIIDKAFHYPREGELSAAAWRAPLLSDMIELRSRETPPDPTGTFAGGFLTLREQAPNEYRGKIRANDAGRMRDRSGPFIVSRCSRTHDGRVGLLESHERRRRSSRRGRTRPGRTEGRRRTLH